MIEADITLRSCAGEKKIAYRSKHQRDASGNGQPQDKWKVNSKNF